jgi:hypothetical protein
VQGDHGVENLLRRVLKQLNEMPGPDQIKDLGKDHRDYENIAKFCNKFLPKPVPSPHVEEPPL